jgi:hypothetical protein
MRVKTEWGTWIVSFCLKVSLSASAIKIAVAARAYRRAASLGKLHQVALINRPLGGARNLAAGSRLLQLLASYVHIRKRVFITTGRPRAGVSMSALLIF